MSNTAKVKDQITEKFLNHLGNSGISKNTLKFYKSDLNNFSNWIVEKVKQDGYLVEDLSQAVPYLTRNSAEEYKSYLSQNSAPLKTINRRLSTLRHLAKLLVELQLIDFNFMEGTNNPSVAKPFNIDPLVERFTGYLQEQKVSRNTIKNYQSDIRHFLNWVDQVKPSA